jgi:hypothetical protein
LVALEISESGLEPEAIFLVDIGLKQNSATAAVCFYVVRAM